MSKITLEKTFRNKDILITGGCGSIGSEIVRQLLEYKPKRIRIFDNNEASQFNFSQELNNPTVRHLIGDIRDKDRVRRAMKGVNIVFHAAALKHVPLCEYNPFEAVQTNVIGTQNLLDIAREEKIDKFLAISTDKAVNPINTMGATKLLCEKLVTASFGAFRTKFACVRFGNVLNSNGSVVPIFKKQLSKGGPITITSDKMTRFFMSISEAVGLVLESMTLLKGGEIFILKMNSLKIKDLAEVMIKEFAPIYNYDPNKIKISIIGVRPGEKLSECLITKEETNYLSEKSNMFILHSPVISPQHTESFKSKKKYSEYDSGNITQLTLSQIKKFLKIYNIL